MPLWIHVFGSRKKEQIDIISNKQRYVVFDRSRIAAEVLVRTELRRIHEDAHDSDISPLLRKTNERKMPLVQCAHGRDKTDLLLLLSQEGKCAAKFGNGADCSHSYKIRLPMPLAINSTPSSALRLC